MPPMVKGSTALVVGGVGPIGRSIVRGFLQAGAEVIINSRSEAKLAALAKDLGHPAGLHCVLGTMMPSGVDRTMEKVLSIGTPSHVVAHAGVAWFTPKGDEDETNILASPRGSLLEMDRQVFADSTGLLVNMQFGVASLLIPKMRQMQGCSYTFITGTSSTMQRDLSPLSRINTHHISGLASALRAESKSRADSIYLSELRIGNLPMRNLPSMAKDPTQMPLSAEIGMLAAGIATTGARWAGPQSGGDLYSVGSLDELNALRARFPVDEVPGPKIPALWHWQGHSDRTLKPRMETGDGE
ncbi:hypothetical protein T492DRAFT_888226 [Pavlovales sp. CCMP2436]|nr:hypothetical protein T492DRAFT_888226 [Pavlovales sp. CCMP2436]